MDKLTKVIVVILSALSNVLEAIFLGAYLGILICTAISILEIFSTQRWSALPVLVVIIFFDYWFGKILLEDILDE